MRAPNQQLMLTKWALVHFALRAEVSVINKMLFVMNSFRLMQFESFQRGSLVAIVRAQQNH